MLLKYKTNILILYCLMLTACGGGDIDFTPHVSTPYNLQITSVSVNSIGLAWEYNGPADITQSFYIYKNGTNVASSSATFATLSGLLPNTQYCIYVTSKNIWYESSPSNTRCATTEVDTSVPYTFNANLVARLTPTGDANIRWNQYFDNVDVVGYKIYRNDIYLTSVTDTTMTDSSLIPGNEYCYYIVAYDITGNESIPTNVSCIDTSWHVADVDSNFEVTSLMSIGTDSTAAVHIVFNDRNSGYLRYTNNKGGTWSFTDIDYIAGGDYKYNSLGIDSNDDVHIAYYDQINGVLKYATNKSGTWVISQIDSETVSGRYVSLVLDNNNYAHISYYTNGILNYLTNVTGSWIKQTLDNTPGHTMSSIGVSPNGHVHIAYADFINKHIVYMTNMSGSWVKTELTTVTGNIPGYQSVLAVDQNDKVHLCYIDGYYLKYLTNKSGAWVSEDTGSSAQGSCSIALSANGNVHIGHQINYSRTINQVSYSLFELTYTTNKDASWKSYVLDDSVSGWYSELAVDKNGAIHIVNMKQYDYALRYATNQ